MKWFEDDERHSLAKSRMWGDVRASLKDWLDRHRFPIAWTILGLGGEGVGNPELKSMDHLTQVEYPKTSQTRHLRNR